MHDFCSVKISPDTSLTGATGVGSISRSLSSSKVGLRLVVDGAGLFAFLTRLVAATEGLSESERVGVLGLRLEGRLDFRTVNFVMFWGRKRETVIGRCLG